MVFGGSLRWICCVNHEVMLESGELEDLGGHLVLRLEVGQFLGIGKTPRTSAIR